MVLFAKDILEKDFISVPGDTNAFDAARLMNEKRHGFVIVSSESWPEGIVTEWDYLSKITSQGKDPAHVKLSEIMTKDMVAVKDTDSFDYIAKLMAERGIRRVLVTKDKKVIGLITSRTVLARLQEYVDRISSLIARTQGPSF
jgi:CBS domain-containing protein